MYTCKICSYVTDDKSNFNKHKKSTKHRTHIENLNKTISNKTPSTENTITSKNKEISCSHCGNQFSRQSSLKRHLQQNRCKGLARRNEEYNIQVMRYKMDMDRKEWEKREVYLQSELEQQKQRCRDQRKFIMSGKAGNTINITIRDLIRTNYQKAPPLEPLADYELSLKNYRKEWGYDTDNNTLVDTLVYHHKNGDLAHFLARFLLPHYKPIEPAQQSMWVLDKNRFSCFIMAMLEGSRGWTYDEHGIQTKKSLIKPLLIFIKSEISDWFAINNVFMGNNLKLDDLNTDKLQRFATVVNLTQSLEDDKIENQIFEILAPHFYTDKNSLLSLLNGEIKINNSNVSSEDCYGQIELSSTVDEHKILLNPLHNNFSSDSEEEIYIEKEHRTVDTESLIELSAMSNSDVWTECKTEKVK